MRVEAHQDDKGRWHWRIFKLLGKVGQAETWDLVEECCNCLDLKTRRFGFRDANEAKNEGSKRIKELDGSDGW